jgi:hypothetical protein
MTDFIQAILPLVQSLGILSTIAIILAYFVLHPLKNINWLTALTTQRGHRKKKLETIIANDKLAPSTRQLAEQQLNALYQFQLTQVSPYTLRDPLVEILVRHKLPGKYFKPFVIYLSKQDADSPLVIRHKLHQTNCRWHRYGIVLPLLTIYIIVAATLLTSMEINRAAPLALITFLMIFSVVLLTLPPTKQAFAQMSIYIEETNQAEHNQQDLLPGPHDQLSDNVNSSPIAQNNANGLGSDF